MQYESQIKKIQKLTEDGNQNSLDVQKLRKIEWMPRPEIFRKQVGVISVCVGFNPDSGTTTQDGFINPLVTVMSGIPTLTAPPLVIPVVLDYAIAGSPVVVPDALLATVATLLLIATPISDDVPVPIPSVAPQTEDDVTNMVITVTPSSTGIPQPLLGTPVFLGPGVVSVPLSVLETTVAGDNPTLTLTFTNSASTVIGATMTVPLSASPVAATQIVPVDINVNPDALTSSPLGNGNLVPIISKFPTNLANGAVPLGVPIVPIQGGPF